VSVSTFVFVIAAECASSAGRHTTRHAGVGKEADHREALLASGVDHNATSHPLNSCESTRECPRMLRMPARSSVCFSFSASGPLSAALPPLFDAGREGPPLRGGEVERFYAAPVGRPSWLQDTNTSKTPTPSLRARSRGRPATAGGGGGGGGGGGREEEPRHDQSQRLSQPAAGPPDCTAACVVRSVVEEPPAAMQLLLPVVQVFGLRRSYLCGPASFELPHILHCT
jgi:hypothetical protein